MSSLILPAESDCALALRESNLLVPGRKPVGSVGIDWSNPLSRDLLYAFVWQGKTCIDFVTGRVISTSNTDDIAVQYNEEGPYLKHSGFLATVNYAPFQNIGTSDFTVISRFRPTTTSRQSLLCSRIADANAHIELRVNSNSEGGASSGGVVFMCKDNAINGAFYSGITATAFQTVAGARSQSDIKLYYNGVFANSVLQTAQNLSGSTSFVFGGLPGTAAIEYSGDRSYDFAWLRELSSDEVAEFHYNPYQLFRSANNTPFVLTLPTGTPSTVTLSNLTFSARTATSITPRLDVTVS